MAKPSVPHDANPIDPADRQRVFTIHVRAPGPPWRGRVVHAASGAVSHFASMDELAAFLGRVLAASD